MPSTGGLRSCPSRAAIGQQWVLNVRLVLDVTEALAVLLQTWNRACYRYHKSSTAKYLNMNYPFEFTP